VCGDGEREYAGMSQMRREGGLWDSERCVLNGKSFAYEVDG